MRFGARAVSGQESGAGKVRDSAGLPSFKAAGGEHGVQARQPLFKRVAYGMIKDYERFQFTSAPMLAEKGDARRMRLKDNSIGGIITSPPYLNNIDYTKVYEVENWFVGLDAEPVLRSYIGLGKVPAAGLEDLPLEAAAYFEDMENVLEEMHRVLADGGRAAVVVGNAFVGGQVIDSDLMLAMLGERVGFKAEAIWSLNQRFALENRTERRGVLRESVVIFRKA